VVVLTMGSFSSLGLSGERAGPRRGCLSAVQSRITEERGVAEAARTRDEFQIGTV
jgi:hypothetical protein